MAKMEEFKNNIESVNLTSKKYLGKLREPAIRAKSALIDTLQKSQISFKKQCDLLEPGKEKGHLERKIDRISKDLEVLKTLPEDEVIIFALTTRRNIMALASNRRIPQVVRLRARIASHKPLSTHLARIKNNETKSEESDAEEQSVEESSKELDKVTLNNQIVTMRKNVRRAKVHTIHKLTRKISSLLKKKGSDKVREKCVKKKKRLVKKIKYIKKLPLDEVSKFALTTPENLEKLINDIKLPMRTQAMASLAVSKFIVEPVADFKSANPDWNKTVPKILRTKSKKRKLKTVDTSAVKSSEKIPDVKTKNNTNSDTFLLSSESDNESDDEQSENSDKSEQGEAQVENDQESDQEESELGGECSDEDEVLEEKVKLKNKTDKDDLISSQSEDDSLSEVLYNRDDVAPMKYTSKVNKKRHKELPIPVTKKKKLKDDIFIKGGTNNTIVESESIKVKSHPKEKFNGNSPKVVDPFFMTTTNEEYVTTQIPIDEDKYSGSKSKKGAFDSWHKQNRFDKFDSRDNWNESGKRNWRPNKFDNPKSQSFNKPFPKHFEKVANGTSSTERLIISTGNRKERRKALKNNLQEEKVEKLHPSWEAKKKQSLIASFQGKKVTFD